MAGLFREIAKELKCGKSAFLLTILEAHGSVPRGKGAMMAVFSDRTAGTIGGGALEKMAIDAAGKLDGDKVETFSLSPADASGLGMVCGGEVTVLTQKLERSALTIIEALCQAEEEGNASWLQRKVENGKVTAMQVSDCSDAPEGWTSVPATNSGKAIIFGGGHVGLALSKLLHFLDMPVVVYDDRQEFANAARFPGMKAVCADFGELEKHVAILPTDYVIVMTRGHKADTAVLRQVLPKEAKYFGCIGSRKKLALCKEQLLNDGISEAVWKKLHAPIGLDIGAETPEEIAVAVAAEIIQVRNQKS